MGKQQALDTANSMTFISDQKHTSAPKGAPCEGGVSDCSDPGPLLDVCAVGCGLCGQTTACILLLLLPRFLPAQECAGGLARASCVLRAAGCGLVAVGSPCLASALISSRTPCA